MKRTKQILSPLLFALLLLTLFSALLPVAYAGAIIAVVPNDVFVGVGRDIMVFVWADDPQAGTAFSIELYVVEDSIPAGVNIWGQTQRGPGNYISSILHIYAGPSANIGHYDVQIKVTWHPWFGIPWTATTFLNLEIRAVAEGAWSENKDLVENDQRWNHHCFGFDWVLGSVIDYPNPHLPYDHKVMWQSDGSGIDMIVEDPLKFDPPSQMDTVLWASEFTQSQSAVPIALTELTLTAVVSDVYSNMPIAPSWTGIKFDVWASSRIDGRLLMMELYFDRWGANDYWGWVFEEPFNGFEVVRTLSNNDHYMVDITHPNFASPDQYERAVKVEVDGEYTTFTVDLSFFFRRAINLFQFWFGYEPGPWCLPLGRSIEDYDFYSIGGCMEAGWIMPNPFPPTTWASFDFLEVTGSYLTDVNCDEKVDMYDVARAAQAYGKVLGDEEYPPEADINKDGEINMKDIAAISSHFGKTSFP